MTLPASLAEMKDWPSYIKERYWPVDAACEEIERKLGLSNITSPDPYAFMCAAYRSRLEWEMADAADIPLLEKNLRRRRFIVLLIGAYERASGKKATMPWSGFVSGTEIKKHGGQFFEFMKLAAPLLGSGRLIPQTDKALARLVEEAFKCRNPK
jgi:hypothetical protein